MKIQLCSDLHLEMRREFKLESTDSNVIVLAGDIALGISGIEFAIEQNKTHEKPIIYVAGNHEFYGYEYTRLLEEMRGLASQYPDVHLLDNDELQLGSVRFLGATLWTDFIGNGTDSKQINLSVVNASLNDHRLISTADGRFTAHDACNRHHISRTWLEENLAIPFEGKTVVITHHGPSLLCQHPNFDYSPIATGFLSDLDNLVAQADLWLFGHTHANLDTQVGECRLVSNQLGYPHEQLATPFDANLVIEI